MAEYNSELQVRSWGRNPNDYNIDNVNVNMDKREYSKREYGYLFNF